MPRKPRLKKEPVAVAEPLERVMANLVDELPPVEEEQIPAERGPRGKWSEGAAKTVPIGEGRLRFRVDPAYNQCQISFSDDIAPRGDSEQAKWVRGLLEEAGFRYFAREKVWGLQRGSDKYQATGHAEETFSRLANTMLGYAGLPPSRAL